MEQVMIRARFATAAIAVAALSASLSACGNKDDAAQPKQSAVAVAQDPTLAAMVPARFKGGVNVASGVYAPMEMLTENGKFTGFDYDLGQALGGKLGIPFRFENQDFDTIIPSLQSSKHNIIMAGMNDTPARQKTLDFVDYFHAGLAILVKKGNPEHISSVLDLCGKTVAVGKATVQADLMRSESRKCPGAGKGPIKLAEVPTEPDAQLQVRAQKATADVLDAAPAEYAAATAGGGKLFEVVHDTQHPGGYAPVDTGIGVLKKDHDLTLALQAALKSLIADGTYKKVLAKYTLTSYAIDSAKINGHS
jgi:polar amino acid transport system substrate-binding protein